MVKIPGSPVKICGPFQFCSGLLYFRSGRYLGQIQID